MATILDGKIVAETIQAGLVQEIASCKARTGRVPGLDVIIVGSDPASQAYVKSKEKLAQKLGLRSSLIELPASATDSELLATITRLNDDPQTDAILVQLPLPAGLDTWRALDAIAPGKDVDCFNPVSQGMILLNRSAIFPCTPAGILRILDHYSLDIAGLNAAVIGRSFIVGKPMSLMLSNRHATVTLCHSKARDLERVLRQADIIVAAIGKPGFVTPAMVKPGAILIDVGINHVADGALIESFHYEPWRTSFAKKGFALVGDIHPGAFNASSYYTPVPGGVGALTPTMLMVNTLELFKQRLHA
jgi:methylenetetrahydrofolate dehydrogenase (NADP+) / methenyltetrahydrofolate cyclohydrolase